MLLDLVGLNFITPVLSGGSTWRLHRKLLRPALTVATIREEYSDLLLADALRYLKAVARSPRNFDASLKRIIGELITKLTFGACADNEGNDYVAKHETLLDYSKRAAAGYLVDFFPILRFIPSWFPLAQFQRDAKVWRSFLKEVRQEMFEGVQQRMSKNEGHPCYVANTIEELQRTKAQSGADIHRHVQAALDSGFAFYQGSLF
ncbi:cytochrome P450 1B1 [Tulasnella sp. UAMH 9824]|nr:cytochrome P450 1B1 [Tulasnella sp. UAMH 9824]